MPGKTAVDYQNCRCFCLLLMLLVLLLLLLGGAVIVTLSPAGRCALDYRGCPFSLLMAHVLDNLWPFFDVTIMR